MSPPFHVPSEIPTLSHTWSMKKGDFLDRPLQRVPLGHTGFSTNPFRQIRECPSGNFSVDSRLMRKKLPKSQPASDLFFLGNKFIQLWDDYPQSFDYHFSKAANYKALNKSKFLCFTQAPNKAAPQFLTSSYVRLHPCIQLDIMATKSLCGKLLKLAH